MTGCRTVLLTHFGHSKTESATYSSSSVLFPNCKKEYAMRILLRVVLIVLTPIAMIALADENTDLNPTSVAAAYLDAMESGVPTKVWFTVSSPW